MGEEISTEQNLRSDNNPLGPRDSEEVAVFSESQPSSPVGRSEALYDSHAR